MSETLLAAVTLALGWLAYTLSSQRFYADLLDRRMGAYHELLDCFLPREMEARDEVMEGSQTNPRPAQEEYLAARNKVFGLFGDEVIKSIENYDQAFIYWVNALYDLESVRSQQRINRYEAAFVEMSRAQRLISEKIQPYVRLGRRGIPLTQRIRMAYKSRRTDHLPGG